MTKSSFFYSTLILGLLGAAHSLFTPAEAAPPDLYPLYAQSATISEPNQPTSLNPLDYSPYPTNHLTAINHSVTGNRIRLVLTTEQKPFFQSCLQNKGRCLQIELINTRQSNIQPKATPKSKDIKSWQCTWPNFNRFLWNINFNSSIQPQNVSTFTLENPNRLVIDIDTTSQQINSLQLTPGITWRRRFLSDPTFGQVLWNELLFDRNDPNVILDVALAGGDAKSTARLSRLVEQDPQIIAGINGGFFQMPNGGALGLIVKDGSIIAPHVGRRPARSVLALTKNNEPFIDRLKVINGQVVRLNGQTVPPLRMALGGGPALLKNGQVYITADAEQLGPKGNDITRACGRSLVAYNKDKLMLATLSGCRDSHSQGWKLPTLANYLLKQGMTDAVNMDGGGSVGMSINGEIVGNGPQAGTYERPIADALVLKDTRGTSFPTFIKVELPQRLTASGQDSGKAVVSAFNSKGNPAANGTVLNLYSRGLSCPPQVQLQNGKAEFTVTALRSPGMANLLATSVFAQGTANMIVAEGSKYHILARLTNAVVFNPVSPVKKADRAPISTETEQEELIPVPQTPLDPNSLDSNGESDDDKENLYLQQIDAGPQGEEECSQDSEQTQDETSKLNLSLSLLVEDEWNNGIAQAKFILEDEDHQVIREFSGNNNGQADLRLTIPSTSRCLFIKSEGAPVLRLNLQPSFSFQEE